MQGKAAVGRVAGVAVNTFAYVGTGVALLPMTFYIGSGFEFQSISPLAWTSVLYMSLFPSVVAYLIYYYALARIPASRLSAFSYLQPLLATAMAIPALGEYPTRSLLAGGILVLAGCFRRGACLMSAFTDLLRNNRNYRYTWIGQVVSEVGDHFNTISVFSLALANTGSGMVVSGIMLSRAVPFLFAGPLAGVLLDRMDRRRLMIASDIMRAVVALGFVFALSKDYMDAVHPERTADVRIAFFTSGRAAILPVIATPGSCTRRIR